MPQHGVAARVICLLGLDDGALRGGTFDGDDILGLHPCIGERHPRHDTRQVLLDALLDAGERFIVTCNGADLTTNQPVPFVVPLVELLDVVAATADATPADDTPPPIAPADIMPVSIANGNTSAIAASGSVPSSPM